MIRELIQKINLSIFERISPARRRHLVSVKIWFEPSLPAGRRKTLEAAPGKFIRGETHDLSRTGISFVVPSVRIDENYLVGENRPLVVEIDLPNGRAQMRVIGKRYEPVGEHLSVSRYLIGASIEHITPENLEIYEHFLKHGSRAKAQNGELKLGIDKS